jgi:hypothetical protein
MIFLPLSIDQSNVSIFARGEEQAVGRRQRAEDDRLVGRFTVVDVDRHFGTREREVRLPGQHQRAGAVAAIGGDEFHIEALVFHEALRQRDIHRHVELRADDLRHLQLDEIGGLRRRENEAGGER